MKQLCPKEGCGREVSFLRTPKGRTVAVDVKPLKVWTEVGSSNQLVKGYQPHRETCAGQESPEAIGEAAGQGAEG